MTDPTPRARRADARRNRDRILAIARQAFHDDGPSVPLHEIAHRAGVSPMTLYRHFATREQLIAAVIDRGIADDVEPVIATALVEPDPWQALVDVISAAVHTSATSSAWRETLASAREMGLLADNARTRIHEPIAALLHRAQQAGVVRPDVDGDDLAPIVDMLRFLVVKGDGEGGAWLRYLSLLLRAPDTYPVGSRR